MPHRLATGIDCHTDDLLRSNYTATPGRLVGEVRHTDDKLKSHCLPAMQHKLAYRGRSSYRRPRHQIHMWNLNVILFLRQSKDENLCSYGEYE